MSNIADTWYVAAYRYYPRSGTADGSVFLDDNIEAATLKEAIAKLCCDLGVDPVGIPDNPRMSGTVIHGNYQFRFSAPPWYRLRKAEEHAQV